MDQEEHEFKTLFKDLEPDELPAGFTNSVMNQLEVKTNTSFRYAPLISTKSWIYIFLGLLGLVLSGLYLSGNQKMSWYTNVMDNIARTKLPDWHFDLPFPNVLAYATCCLAFFVMVQVVILKYQRRLSV